MCARRESRVASAHERYVKLFIRAHPPRRRRSARDECVHVNMYISYMSCRDATGVIWLARFCDLCSSCTLAILVTLQDALRFSRARHFCPSTVPPLRALSKGSSTYESSAQCHSIYFTRDLISYIRIVDDRTGSRSQRKYFLNSGIDNLFTFGRF